MAFSIESRVPFLDHRLVEFVFRKANEFRIHKGWTKWIHRKAMEKRMPSEITWRRDKVGFEIPEGKWIRESRQWMEELMSPGSAGEEYLDLNCVRRCLQDAARLGDGRTEASTRIWRWVNLAVWLDSIKKASVCKPASFSALSTAVA